MTARLMLATVAALCAGANGAEVLRAGHHRRHVARHHQPPDWLLALADKVHDYEEENRREEALRPLARGPEDTVRVLAQTLGRRDAPQERRAQRRHRLHLRRDSLAHLEPFVAMSKRMRLQRHEARWDAGEVARDRLEVEALERERDGLRRRVASLEGLLRRSGPVGGEEGEDGSWRATGSSGSVSASSSSRTISRRSSSQTTRTSSQTTISGNGSQTTRTSSQTTISGNGSGTIANVTVEPNESSGGGAVAVSDTDRMNGFEAQGWTSGDSPEATAAETLPAFTYSAPAPAPWSPTAYVIDYYHMNEKLDAPEQGFEGPYVQHDDLKSATSDWSSEWPQKDETEEQTVKSICEKQPVTLYCKLWLKDHAYGHMLDAKRRGSGRDGEHIGDEGWFNRKVVEPANPHAKAMVKGEGGFEP